MEVESLSGFWSIEPEELHQHPFWCLTEAVRQGDIALVHRLLSQGAGLVPERPLPASLNPLVIEAACCGQRDVLELVLDRDSAAISAVDVAHSATPLHWAALRGDWGTAHLLLSKSADLLSVSREGFMPLHCAALRGHRCLLELLLEKGAPIDAPTSTEGATALILAAGHGFVHCVEALLQRHANLNLADAQGVTALLAAAAAGEGPTARLLIRHGADPAARDTVHKRGLLHWVAYHCMDDVAEDLLRDASLEVDTQDAFNETPLLLASRRGSSSVAEALLQRGAAVDQAGRLGITPLMSAAFFGHMPVVRALLDRGANVRAIDTSTGRTPLHWCAASDAAEVAQLLLESAAADVAALDNGGLTPFDLALECDAEAVMKLMQGMAQGRHQ